MLYIIIITSLFCLIAFYNALFIINILWYTICCKHCNKWRFSISTVFFAIAICLSFKCIFVQFSILLKGKHMYHYYRIISKVVIDNIFRVVDEMFPCLIKTCDTPILENYKNKNFIKTNFQFCLSDNYSKVYFTHECIFLIILSYKLDTCLDILLNLSLH